jgi:hypothetical protein
MDSGPGTGETEPDHGVEDEQSEEASKRKLTRRQKVAAAIAAAFLAGIGAGLAAWLMRGAEEATKQIFQIWQPANAPITVRVAEPGTYLSAHVFDP